MQWLSDNREWVFSGIGATVIAAIFGIIKSKTGFKLTHRFYILAFLSVVLFLGVDYFVNYEGDLRLRFFIFGIAVILTFSSEWAIHHIIQKHKVRKAVKELSLEDCKYVLKCHSGTEIFKFDFHSVSSLPSKFDNILYIPTGDRIIINKPYEICVYKYAYKVAKKRIKKDNLQSEDLK